MSQVVFDTSAIDTVGDMTLVLGQRTSGVKGFRVAMHTDVESELRTICEATVATLRERTPVAYLNDLAFDPASQYLVVPLETLVAHRPESRRGRRVGADVPRAIVEVDVTGPLSSVHRL